MSATIAITRRERWRAGWRQFRRSRLALPGLILLLVFLIAMNLIAIILRRRFERRW